MLPGNSRDLLYWATQESEAATRPTMTCNNHMVKHTAMSRPATQNNSRVSIQHCSCTGPQQYAHYFTIVFPFVRECHSHVAKWRGVGQVSVLSINRARCQPRPAFYQQRYCSLCSVAIASNGSRAVLQGIVELKPVLLISRRFSSSVRKLRDVDMLFDGSGRIRSTVHPSVGRRHIPQSGNGQIGVPAQPIAARKEPWMRAIWFGDRQRTRRICGLEEIVRF